MNYKSFTKRVIQYAKQTGIQMHNSGRHLRLKPLGLPDPRGFTPHLRSIMLDTETFEELRTKKASFSGERKWLIHDMLHIMFYDFAFLQLGLEAFTEKSRYLEVHLASEAFAVLALDYHVLSQEDGAGLAVEFNRKDWPKFQKINPSLPHYLSTEFLTVLTNLYLSGQGKAFSSPKPSPEFEVWAGHERRYSEKQRLYIGQWRADLDGEDFDGNIPTIENSAVAEVLHELLSLLLGGQNEWLDYLSQIDSKFPENYFSDLNKYRRKASRPYDYRFTDFRSVEKQTWQQDLEAIHRPNPSQLFLFLQLASSIQEWKEIELSLLRDFYASTNSPKVDEDSWRMVHEVLIGKTPKVDSLPPKSQLNACFFLP